jgi:hypothetical protein
MPTARSADKSRLFETPFALSSTFSGQSASPL